jgi:SAM-dependent methyltransferase
MKRSAIRFLVCPSCKDELELQVRETDGPEILEGSLRSPACGREYPILRGVPRFVDSGEYASSFGFQWNQFRSVQLDSSNGRRESEQEMAATTGWTERDYRGRLILDAGVGAGRYADVVSAKGGEVVGVDLTIAVDAAYANIGRREGVHIIQADIFAMPFRDATFDIAYSIGVLHHTPDTRAAFARVARTVKPGGSLAVYLYGGYGFAHRFPDAIRKVTTRLPSRVTHALAAVAVPLYYPYRVPGLGKLLHLVFPISLHPDWRWRWLNTFDWYSPRYQWKLLYPEVFRWFRENGFHEVEIFDEPIRMRGLKEIPSARQTADAGLGPRGIVTESISLPA